MISLEIRVLDNNHQDIIEQFLQNSLCSSLVLLSNLRKSHVEYNGQPYSGTYVGQFNQDKLLGLAAHFWNGMIILQTDRMEEDLLEKLLRHSDRPITGIMGPDQSVQQCKSLLFNNNDYIQLSENSILYHLQLNNLRLPGLLLNKHLNFRKLDEKDIPYYIEWMQDYAHETLNAVRSEKLNEHSKTITKQALRNNNTWILEFDNVPVSTCTITAKTREALGLGAIWTPVEHRSRHYSRTLIAAALFDAWTQKIPYATLFTDKTNYAAQKSYESLGFQQVGTYGLILLKQKVKFKLHF